MNITGQNSNAVAELVFGMMLTQRPRQLRWDQWLRACRRDERLLWIRRCRQGGLQVVPGLWVASLSR